MRHVSVWVLLGGLFAGCATAPPPPPPPDPLEDENKMLRVEVEERTTKLLEATDALRTARNSIDEQRRRLQLICVDYPDHASCDLQSAAQYARAAFCGDAEFTKHIDGVVSACHQGQCKQVDEAQFISRTNYMRLVQRLPHSLVLFKVYDTKLDRKDKKQMQAFIEQVDADKGYIIVVGRASRDGPWEDNLRLALERAESARQYLVDEMGISSERVGYITYGDPKMFITATDAERVSGKKLTVKQANRSAFVFAYPCFDGENMQF